MVMCGQHPRTLHTQLQGMVSLGDECVGAQRWLLLVYVRATDSEQTRVQRNCAQDSHKSIKSHKLVQVFEAICCMHPVTGIPVIRPSLFVSRGMFVYVCDGWDRFQCSG